MAENSTVHFRMRGYAAKVRELTTRGGEATVWDCEKRRPKDSRPLLLETHTEFVSAVSCQRKGNRLLPGIPALALSTDDRKAVVGREDESVWMAGIS